MQVPGQCPSIQKQADRPQLKLLIRLVCVCYTDSDIIKIEEQATSKKHDFDLTAVAKHVIKNHDS